MNVSAPCLGSRKTAAINANDGEASVSVGDRADAGSDASQRGALAGAQGARLINASCKAFFLNRALVPTPAFPPRFFPPGQAPRGGRPRFSFVFFLPWFVTALLPGPAPPFPPSPSSPPPPPPRPPPIDSPPLLFVVAAVVGLSRGGAALPSSCLEIHTTVTWLSYNRNNRSLASTALHLNAAELTALRP